MSDLPRGWIWTTLEELLAVEDRAITDGPFGSKLASRHYTTSGARVIRLQNIGDCVFNNERAYISLDYFDELRAHEARAGDLVVASLGENLPRACIIPELGEPAIVKADCIRVRLHPEIDTKWVLYALTAPPTRQYAASHIRGVGRPRLGLGELRKLPIPLPPLAEQRRIVAAIEGNLSRLSVASFAADTASRRSKKFISSVLEMAATGRLSSTLKTDSDVIELIEQSHNLLAESRSRTTSGRRKRELPPDAARTIAPYDLPSTWRWVPWRELGESRNGGAFPSSYYQDQGIKLIRPGNMDQSGRVVWSPSNTRFLPEKFVSIKPDLVIRGRALILNLTAQSLRDEFLGRACITEINEAALLNQRLAWLVPARIDLDYISIIFRSPIFRRFVARLNTGSLIQHMFTWQVDQFQVPVPPLEEQHRIVAHVSELLDGADRMTRVVLGSQRKAQALRVQLLSDAFSGRLAPQDPMDEPASVVVARIRAELMARPRLQRRRGMTKPTPQEETLL